jgi:hypothetical protein
MTPREFFSAWIGYNQQKKEEYSVLFYCLQYNAMRTAFSKEQQRAIKRDKAPWQDTFSKGKTEPLSYDKMKPLFDSISTN